MSKVLALGYKAVTSHGVSGKWAEVGAKEFAGYLKNLIKGSPKGQKKKFYQLYEQYLNNPNNERIKAQIDEIIGHSEMANRYIANAQKEYVAKLSQTHISNSPLSPKAQKEFVEQNQQFIEELAQRHAGLYKLDYILRQHTLLSGYNTKYAIRGTIDNLGNTISHAIESSMPKFELTDAQIGEMVEKSMKNYLNEFMIRSHRMNWYPVNKLISLTFPKDIKQLYKGLMDLPKDKFGSAFYEKLVTSRKIADRAPKSIEVTKDSARMTATSMLSHKTLPEGGFSSCDNTIKFTKEFVEVPRALQANLITHELEHWAQADATIRTFGINKYIQALKDNDFKSCKLIKDNAGKSDKEIWQIVEDFWKQNNFESRIREAFKSSINAERIDASSPLGQKAGTYLEALRNYVAPQQNGFLLDVPKEYTENLLEKCANKAGRKMGFFATILESLNIMHI